MAKTDNLTDFLTNTADAIRTAEGSTNAINPQDFEAKITALKLSVQTADANATAADILSGKTAWVKGTKISGSIGTKAATTIIPGTSDQTIASGVYLAGTQTIKGDSNLTADNIKSGTSIFGVTGSYAGSSPNLQSKSVTYTSNGTATITPDAGYDGLSSVDVTVNVASVSTVTINCDANDTSAFWLSPDGVFHKKNLNAGANTIIVTPYSPIGVYNAYNFMLTNMNNIVNSGGGVMIGDNGTFQFYYYHIYYATAITASATMISD